MYPGITYVNKGRSRPRLSEAVAEFCPILLQSNDYINYRTYFDLLQNLMKESASWYLLSIICTIYFPGSRSLDSSSAGIDNTIEIGTK